eukprot:116734_1
MSQRRSLRLQASKPVDYTAERITLDCTTSVTRPTTTRNKNKKSKSTATTTRIDPKQLSTNTVPVVSYNDISVASVAQVQPDYGANSHKTDVHNTDVIEDDDVFKYGSAIWICILIIRAICVGRSLQTSYCHVNYEALNNNDICD